VHLDKDNQGCLAGILLPLKTMHLQSLKLHGPVGKLPDLKISQLGKLTKLDLEMTILTETDIKLINNLPKLCTLRIKLFQDSQLNFCIIDIGGGLELRTFQKVKVLEIASSSNVHVTFGAETMPKLELLKAHCGKVSSLTFSGLNNPTELKVVLLKGCYGNELKEEVQSQLLQHRKNPVLEEEPCSS
jgi:hypothetical protein